MAAPIRGNVYTLAQVLKLDLDDESPFLIFVRSKSMVIQTSHVTDDDLLKVPGMADSQWRYLYTTDECCPIFHFVGPGPITDLVDIVGTLATPKGFPRERV